MKIVFSRPDRTWNVDQRSIVQRVRSGHPLVTMMSLLLDDAPACGADDHPRLRRKMTVGGVITAPHLECRQLSLRHGGDERGAACGKPPTIGRGWHGGVLADVRWD